MSDDLDRPISPASSYTSESDSTRREFFASTRVQASPTPTPLSETPRDFQLIMSAFPVGQLTYELNVQANPSSFTTNSCNCGPECRQPCCVNSVQGWMTSSQPKLGSGGVGDQKSIADKLVQKLELNFTDADGKRNSGVHVHSMEALSSAYPRERSRVSVGSNDSGGLDCYPSGGEGRGETPLLPPDKQQCCGGFTTITSTVS